MNIRRPTDLQKKRDKRDTKKKYIIASIGVAFLLVGIGVVITIKQSSLFRVREIMIVGVPPAYGEQVRSAIEAFTHDHSFLARFLGAENVLAWDGNPKEFLAENPQFKLLRIQKDYIKRTVTITVSGREKFGVWCGATDNSIDDVSIENSSSTTDIVTASNEPLNECYWFDRDGVLFAKAPQVQSELFNRVYDSTGRVLTLRDAILPEALLANLMRVFTLLDVAQINTKTVFIRDIALEEVDTNSLSDPRLLFSLRSDPTFSLSAINALKQSGDWERLEYVDFRAENRASYR